MSIQGALYTALSSLSVLQKQTSLISNNVANATTPGYVQENLPQYQAQANGGGAGVVAGQVQRLANDAAAAAANQASSAQSYSQAMVNALTIYTGVVGQASDSTSLTSMVSAFNTALTTLSVTPADATAQIQTVNAASNVASTFNTLDDAIAAGRTQADQDIEAAVADTNNILTQLSQNESARSAAVGLGQSTAPFDDKRDQLVASMAKNLPVKVIHTGNDGIAVTTDRGTTLWDGTVHKLSFTATPTVPTTMRVTADPANGLTGGLSQVTVDGQVLQASQSGTIQANLQLRDVTLPQFAGQLDQVAAGLITAFQQADPTVAAGQTGLFTAGGNPITASTPVAGLAGSIAVNDSVDPAQGGAAWRIRDGAQATTPGAASDNGTILAYLDTLATTRSFSTVNGLSAALSISDATAQVSGLQQSTLSRWTQVNDSRTQQAQDAQTALVNQTGVNIDEQMQRLMIVQQSYAASGQVIRTAASMLDTMIQTLAQA